MIDIKQVHKSFGNREILKGIDLTCANGICNGYPWTIRQR